jgi:small-conductance mechanosensitive channel
MQLTHYSIVSIGFLIALAAAGIELNQFAILFGALGVGIGFGLQTLVNNFVSGLILMFERPIQVGDTVEVGTLVGTVKRIGIRSSIIRTFSGAEVIVPNGNLIAGELINWTFSDSLRRIELQVGVAYGTDPKQVLDILMNTATAHEKTLDNPEPQSLFKEFGDSSLNFEIRVWTADPMWLQVSSDIMTNINAALAEAGITIPFPQRDLHVKSVEVPLKDALQQYGSKSTRQPSDQP